MSFIKVDNVSKTYRSGRDTVVALSNLSISIERGSFVNIIGGSGCGKTTLLNLLAGFERPDSGSVYIDGKPVEKPNFKHQTIFQSYGLLPWRTVAGNVALALENLRGLTRREKQAKIHHNLELVGLQGYQNFYSHQLSGGMKQRVSIARALAAEPDTIFMDEPFGALDAINRMKLQDELITICELSNKTIVMVTHDVDEAVYLGDRVLVMKSNPGRLVLDIGINLSRPRHRNQGDFLSLRSKLLEALDLASRPVPVEFSI